MFPTSRTGRRRLGFSYDVTGHGRTVIRGSFSKYMQGMATNLSASREPAPVHQQWRDRTVELRRPGLHYQWPAAEPARSQRIQRIPYNKHPARSEHPAALQPGGELGHSATAALRRDCLGERMAPRDIRRHRARESCGSSFRLQSGHDHSSRWNAICRLTFRGVQPDTVDPGTDKLSR